MPTGPATMVPGAKDPRPTGTPPGGVADGIGLSEGADRGPLRPSPLQWVDVHMHLVAPRGVFRGPSLRAASPGLYRQTSRADKRPSVRKQPPQRAT